MTRGDDLGRVVIPKEIRRTMRIREGDPLEIYTDREGEVIFKKYSPIGELQSFAQEYAETLNKTSGMPIIITDRDAVHLLYHTFLPDLYPVNQDCDFNGDGERSFGEELFGLGLINMFLHGSEQE